uniref:Putative secreted protein n=1 Tax=Xenopsylla cheopis TaxID=163159 RepID=A0A6M2DXI5_XENCH
MMMMMMILMMTMMMMMMHYIYSSFVSEGQRIYYAATIQKHDILTEYIRIHLLGLKNFRRRLCVRLCWFKTKEVLLKKRYILYETE